jgi:GNAT superfamily N-acetyltransferase
MAVEYSTSAGGVDWSMLKADLAADHFDNGRTPEQMERSFGASFRCVFGRQGQRIVGTGRVISDGVCNAYLVDMWTHSAHRRRGIGKRMLELLCQGLAGQHLYLFTDDAEAFYKACGFVPRGVGMERVIGTWLQNETQK